MLSILVWILLYLSNKKYLKIFVIYIGSTNCCQCFCLVYSQTDEKYLKNFCYTYFTKVLSVFVSC